MASITTTESGTVMFEGREAVGVFRAVSIAHGLKLYARCGLKPNRAWTPTAMLKAAGDITGRKFKRGQYVAAAEALLSWAQEARAALS